MEAIERIIKKIEQEKCLLARNRDRFREIEQEARGMGDDCDEALEHLTDAVDALSRQV